MPTPTMTLHLIEELLNHRQDPAALLRSMELNGFTPQVLDKLNQVVPEFHPYSRLILSSHPSCEVMLARWSPGVSCAPHDHGQSTGWVFYLQGSFLETAYEWSGSGLRSSGLSRHQTDSYARVRQNEIHSCVSSTGGLSLHIYFPRIEAMKVFDTVRGRTLIVSDDCGAWIPEHEQIIDENKWQSEPATTVAF